MKNTYNFYILIFVIYFSLSAKRSEAQGTANSPLKIIAPSPTAASLGDFGKVPISCYTGTANVTVPLYDIKTNNHNLSINLQYASSGLKPGEDASWAGLGWSLKAGGVITRVVRGNPDLNNGIKGYYYPDAIPPNDASNYYNLSSPTFNADIDKFKNMITGYTDGEPDIFYYSFADYSGKFVMGKPAYPTPGIKYEASRTNLDIYYDESVFGQEGWIMTDGKGYKYYFYAREITDEYMNSSHTTVANQQVFEDNMSIDPINTSPVTSWYMTKIEAPSGETITFDYLTQGPSTTKSPVAYYEDMSTMLNWNTMTPSCQSSLAGTYYNFQVAREVHFAIYLNKITFKNGYVLINSNETDKYRTDIVYTGTAPQKFKKLEVFDNAGNLIKKFVLDYGYFGTSGNTLNARLRLDKVTEYASDGITAKPAYQFSYFNSTGTFPDKNTKGLDWWNYYNGITNNTTLVSRAKVAGTVYAGAYRLASNNTDDPTASFLKTGILTSITYPTGGRTAFTYERNVYSNIGDLDGMGDISKNASGLRIKAITNYDPDNLATIKKYYYTNEGYSDTTNAATSSGILISTPSFVVTKTLVDSHPELVPLFEIGASVTQSCYSNALYLVRTSASNAVSGFNSNGAIVGYSKVTEVTGPTGEGGIKEYYYKNDADVLNDVPGAPNINYSTNGQLIKEIYKDNNLQWVKQITYQYTSSETST